MKRPVIEGQFVNFLITQGDPGAVTEAASHLLRTGSKDSTETLLEACDWLIAHKRPDLALPLWNGLANTDFVPFAGCGFPRHQWQICKIAHFPRLRLAPHDGGRGEFLSER